MYAIVKFWPKASSPPSVPGPSAIICPTLTFSDPFGYGSGYFFPPELKSLMDPGARANLLSCPYMCIWKV